MSVAGWRMAVQVAAADSGVELQMRLLRYRAAHPGVLIGDMGFGGIWQALIAGPDGEHVYTRYLLEDLLDLLDGLDSPPGGGGPPGGDYPPGGP